MPLSREEVEQIAKSSAQTVLEGLHRYAVAYKEPETIEQGLQDSMIEERTAADWYRKRADNASIAPIDSKTFNLYRHIAEEEDRHYDELNARLQQINPQGNTREYMVDNIKVIIRYERPGVHEVTIEAPGGRSITEEEGRKIDKLLDEVVDKGNPGAKEPWQMTREEYVKSAREWRAEFMPRLTGRALEDELEHVAVGHKIIVLQSLGAGKPVSPEVLKDYPELAKEP